MKERYLTDRLSQPPCFSVQSCFRDISCYRAPINFASIIELLREGNDAGLIVMLSGSDHPDDPTALRSMCSAMFSTTMVSHRCTRSTSADASSPSPLEYRSALPGAISSCIRAPRYAKGFSRRRQDINNRCRRRRSEAQHTIPKQRQSKRIRIQ